MKHKKRIYLDYAAATPLDPRVLQKMMPFLEKDFGNPSSVHEEGRQAKSVVEQARKEVAGILGAAPDEIIFTGSGTESAALALMGTMHMYPHGHIVTTALEHAAVLENVPYLRNRTYAATVVDAGKDGAVQPKHIADALRKETVLVSVVYVNSEVGSIKPLSAIARIVRKERQRRKEAGENMPLYFHTDACQAAEYMPLFVPRLGVDMLTLNGSKIYGPKGIGVLYKRRGIQLAPLWKGGGQEHNLRSGTEHVAGIVGFAEALRIAEKRKQKEYARMVRLQRYFINQLRRLVPQAVLQGPSAGALRVPHNINAAVPGISAETLVLYLDEHGVAASSGSACASNRHGSDAKTKSEGVRFTMGRHTTHADIDYAVSAFRDSIETLKPFHT